MNKCLRSLIVSFGLIINLNSSQNSNTLKEAKIIGHFTFGDAWNSQLESTRLWAVKLLLNESDDVAIVEELQKLLKTTGKKALSSYNLREISEQIELKIQLLKKPSETTESSSSFGNFVFNIDNEDNLSNDK